MKSSVCSVSSQHLLAEVVIDPAARLRSSRREEVSAGLAQDRVQVRVQGFLRVTQLRPRHQ